jgi:hypothetical protein
LHRMMTDYSYGCMPNCRLKPLPPPSQVSWYVGQTVADGRVVVVVFEANENRDHVLVTGWAPAAAVLHDQPGYVPWVLNVSAAPDPRDTQLAIGLNFPGPARGRSAGPDNWIIVLAAPDVREVAWTAVTASGTHHVSARTDRGLVVADTGQVTRRVVVTGLITSRGNVLRGPAAVGGTAQGGGAVPQLALPVRLDPPASFQLIRSLTGQGAEGINLVLGADPGRTAVVVARCYGPAPLQIYFWSYAAGVIRCDGIQQDLVIPRRGPSGRLGIIKVATLSALTAWRMDVGTLPPQG